MHEKQASHTFLAQFRPRLTHPHTRKYTYKPGKHTTPHQTHVYTNTTFTIPSPITRIETRHVWPCCLLLIVFETCCRRKERHLQKDRAYSTPWTKRTPENTRDRAHCLLLHGDLSFSIQRHGGRIKKTSPNTQGSIMIIIIAEAGRHDWPRQGSWPQQGVASKHRQWENTKKGIEMEACCQAN